MEGALDSCWIAVSLKFDSNFRPQKSAWSSLLYQNKIRSETSFNTYLIILDKDLINYQNK